MAERKLTQIHIADNKTDEILDFIPETDYWNDERKRTLKDNRDTFDFETFATETYSGALEERNRIIIPNKHDNSHSEFIIEEAAQIMDDSGLHYKATYTTASYLELRKQKLIPPQTTNSMSPEGHVDFALAGTEWQKGNIDYGENHTTVLTAYMDAYSYLQNIANWSGMELSFRVEHNGYRVTGRYVDLVDRQGVWRGHEAVFGKDLLSIERRRKFDAVVTALIGLGPDNDDGTPREEVYIESATALSRWGRNGKHLVEVYEPQSEDQNISPQKLFDLTQEELNRRISHQSEYMATIATLADVLDVDPTDLQFGDIIRIKDEEFNPPIYLEARIHEMTESIKAYGDSQVVLGDFTEFSEDEVKSILNRLRQQIADKVSNAQMVEAIDNAGYTAKYTQPTPPTDLEGLWIDNSNRPYVTKVYLDAVEGWVPIMPATATEIGADPAGSAADALAAARVDIAAVNDSHTILRNEYDDFIADGFISRSEAMSIERHIQALNSEKSDVDADYTATYSNPKLPTAEQSALANAKTAYNLAHGDLIIAINNAIADGYVTSIESTGVDTAFNNYSDKLGLYSTARANAGYAITSKEAGDAKAGAEAYTRSRGENLVTNGTGLLGDNTNFTDFTFDGAQVFAGAGSFHTNAQNSSRFNDELIPVDTSKRYRISVNAKSKLGIGHNYLGLSPYDVDGNLMTPYQYFGGSFPVVTLTQPAAPGDTVLYLSDVSSFIDNDGAPTTNHTHSLVFWGYVNSYGYTYPTGTYSRLVAAAAWDNAAIDRVNNTITLNSPLGVSNPKDPNGVFPIGHEVSKTQTGGTYMYCTAVNVKFPADGWETFSGEVYGVSSDTNSNTFPPGTAFIRFLALTNRSSSGGQAGDEIWLNGVEITDITMEDNARADASQKADAAQAAADAYSAAQADLAKTEAMAYADGIITDEEAARIQDAQDKLAEAKAHADQAAADAVAAIDNSDLATKDELNAETDAIRDQLTTRGGANLLRNSIGYADLDFWTFSTTNQNVQTIMNEALTTLGFGCGFYFPPDGLGKGIQQSVNVVEGEEYTLGWYAQRQAAGSFTIEILQGTTVIASASDISTVGAGYQGTYLSFTPTTGNVIIRFTAAGTTELTLTGLMLSVGNLPAQWTLASGELYNAFVRADERGLLVLGLDAQGNIERKTIMSPDEFAGYYDENRDGNFERVFWLNQDETVTKKLRALEEITMGTIKIVRIESAQNRGWAFVPIVPE